jgi:hypothetical protein
MLLPLNYSPDFTWQKLIKDEYAMCMGRALENYCFSILLNGNELFKPYRNGHILESDIVFWPLQFRAKSADSAPTKFGVLWFTFNRLVKVVTEKGPYGIMVRSKNMLVGSTDALAQVVSNSKSDYVATDREITQTLSSVYGEILIDTNELSDNARRDWFKVDSASLELRNIIAEFLRRLISYRNAASKALNDKNNNQKKNKFIKTYTELTCGIDAEHFPAAPRNQAIHGRSPCLLTYRACRLRPTLVQVSSADVVQPGGLRLFRSVWPPLTEPLKWNRQDEASRSRVPSGRP